MSNIGSAMSNITLVPESPAAKRQRTNGGYQSTSNSTGYNSAADSGDDLFDGIETTPVKTHYTQPTQIIDRGQHPILSSPVSNVSEVQIPASSPFQSSARPITASRPIQSMPIPARGLASSIAPAGTAFRTPHGVVRAPTKKPKAGPIVIDLSDDDGPQYKGGSSDDEGVGTNIKPTSFGIKQKNTSFGSNGSAGSPQSDRHMKFSSIVQAAKYQQQTSGAYSSVQSQYFSSQDSSSSFPSPANIRSADGMSTGYGSRNPPTQNRPARAIPVDEHYSDTSDLDMRRKIDRLHAINPAVWSILDCRNALVSKKGDIDAAANLLSGPIVLDDDDDDELGALPVEPQMKMGIAAPVKSIQERYSSTQLQRKPSLPAIAATAQEKPRRKLMKGRRDPTSPVQLSSQPAPSPLRIVLSDNEDYNSDSENKSESEDDPDLDGRVLNFLNRCKVEELADLTNIKVSAAEAMIAARPFRNLDAARDVSDAPAVTKAGKQSRKKPIGENIVQTAINMMSGYEAVDALVAKCEELGKPLADEMAKWGFDVFGSAKKGGELEMTSLEDSEDVVGAGKRRPAFLKQPLIMSEDVTLKDYQLVGLNWLHLLHKHQLSCILADDMGLGKTCQVVAFISQLVEDGVNGPHLVVVPPSTLENWLREFAKFSPSLIVEPYSDSQAARAIAADLILDNRDSINVVITTYEYAKNKVDNKFLRNLRPKTCVFDEGHVLKNPNSLKYQGLMRIPASFRLLLTGTPLQNNLLELAALLAFIMPDIFEARKEDLDFIFKNKATTSGDDHAALLSAQRISRARSMLTPFVLRRKKDQVLKHMPAKICRVEYCDMDGTQKEIYTSLQDKATERLKLRLDGVKLPADKENNPMMQLRKAALHPMLFRRFFTDDKLVKMLPILKRKHGDQFTGRDDQIMGEMKAYSDYYLHYWCTHYSGIKSFDMPDLSWMNSGKVSSLVKLLKQYKENGDRVLVFSQFVLVLDILEEVLQTSLIKYSRIDGATRVSERQTLIDQFRDDTSITAFLLSTGAGGTGINLMFANKVIIFDSSFNPQDDVQAENRAHRVGQTREVEVVRLVTKGTIEEAIYALGQSKLALDAKVAGGGSDDMEAKGEDFVARMLLKGAEEREESASPKVGSKRASPDGSSLKDEDNVPKAADKETKALRKTAKLPSRKKGKVGKKDPLSDDEMSE